MITKNINVYIYIYIYCYNIIVVFVRTQYTRVCISTTDFETPLKVCAINIYTTKIHENVIYVYILLLLFLFGGVLSSHPGT